MALPSGTRLRSSLEPGMQLVPERLGQLLASLRAGLLALMSRELALDPVDLGDAPERLRRHDAGVVLDQLVELPPRVGQAA